MPYLPLHFTDFRSSRYFHVLESIALESIACDQKTNEKPIKEPLFIIREVPRTKATSRLALSKRIYDRIYREFGRKMYILLDIEPCDRI